MPLSERTVKELEAELGQQEAQLRQLEAEKAQLEGKLAAGSERIAALRALLGKPATLTKDGAASTGMEPTPSEEGGLRSGIRSVLATAPQGLKPRQVTQGLKKRGFATTGQMEIGIRVGNELWRMHKAGKLGKTKDGRYLLLREEGEP